MVLQRRIARFKRPLYRCAYRFHVFASTVGRSPSGLYYISKVDIYYDRCRDASAAFRLPKVQHWKSNTTSELRSTHLRLARPPVFLFVVAVCQLRVLVYYYINGQLPLLNLNQLTRAACAKDPLVPVTSSARFLSGLLNCTHHSSGSSSITSCAAAARAFSSFDILKELDFVVLEAKSLSRF